MKTGWHWFTTARVRLYCQGFLMLYMAFTYLGYVRPWLTFQRFPVTSFAVFWAGARLALAGQAAEVYQVDHLRQVILSLDPAVQGTFGWFYPPVFLLFVLPLGFMAYSIWAWLAFILPTTLAFWRVMKQAMGSQMVPLGKWILLASPGVWLNLWHGQNGFLMTALAGATLMCLESRPLLAGVFLGCLGIKPQWAVLFPLALAFGGYWRTLGVAALVFIGEWALAAGIWGWDVLLAWRHGLSEAGHLIGQGGIYWTHAPTVFAALRLIGLPYWLAMTVHGLVAAGTAVTVSLVWRRRVPVALKAAVLMTGTFLISPYLMDYDLVGLLLPGFWLARVGLRTGWRVWEREWLVLAWLLPLLCPLMTVWWPLQVGPGGVLGVLGVLVHSTRSGAAC